MKKNGHFTNKCLQAIEKLLSLSKNDPDRPIKRIFFATQKAAF